MKKIIAFIIFTFGFWASLQAQTPQVTAGTSQTLTAAHNNGSTFIWTIIGNVTGTTVAGLGNGNAVTFTWPIVVDTYTITVLTTDVDGCQSDPFTQQAQVFARPTVQFAVASDILGVCSAATSISDNGSSDVIVNYTGAQPWKLTYSVVDETNIAITGLDNVVVPNLTGSYTINVPHTFVNTSSTVKNWQIIINGAQSADGVDVNAIDTDRNIVVYPKPVITNLTLN